MRKEPDREVGAGEGSRAARERGVLHPAQGGGCLRPRGLQATSPSHLPCQAQRLAPLRRPARAARLLSSAAASLLRALNLAQRPPSRHFEQYGREEKPVCPCKRYESLSKFPGFS